MAKRISIDYFKRFVEIISPNMDNYLFCCDFEEDCFYIAQNALERFALPAAEFNKSLEVISGVIYPEDFPRVISDLRNLRSGASEEHDMKYRWIDKEGKIVWINCRAEIVVDEANEKKYIVGSLNEIGRKQMADNISGLLGESSFYAELDRDDYEKLQGYILRVGIDNFKEINENRGILYGDMILQRTAECIRKAILPGQKLYRLVADEFAIVDTTGRELDSAKTVYRKIAEEIRQFIVDNQYEVFFTVSGGIVELDAVRKQKFDHLMKISEFALNQAKENGRNQYWIFDQEEYDSFRHKRWLIQVMRKAINRGYAGFEAYYQPIVNIDSKAVTGAETLMRFRTGDGTMISPGEFIPLLEESGLIVPVGRWILYQALEACKKIREIVPEFRISVNVSYIQVLKSDILGDIKDALALYDLPAESLMVELTESGLLEDNMRFRRFCEGMREKGVLLALDDFGTGYSNFHYLYSLNPYTIKIDRSFTIKAIMNENEYNLLRHMVEMTHGIELKLCIEGIETEPELEKICSIKPDYIQGYYFGKPCPFSDFMTAHILTKGA